MLVRERIRLENIAARQGLVYGRFSHLGGNEGRRMGTTGEPKWGTVTAKTPEIARTPWVTSKAGMTPSEASHFGTRELDRFCSSASLGGRVALCGRHGLKQGSVHGLRAVLGNQRSRQLLSKHPKAHEIVSVTQFRMQGSGGRAPVFPRALKKYS